jgi:hypothetical protein
MPILVLVRVEYPAGGAMPVVVDPSRADEMMMIVSPGAGELPPKLSVVASVALACDVPEVVSFLTLKPEMY